METQNLPPLLQKIGGTPLVELSHLTKGLDGHILAKLEYFNPGGSKKDRIALQMIIDAKADGTLKDGQTVVELTSGNTGTGLAIVCAALGHPFVAVISEGNTRERHQFMAALGAEVILVPQVTTDKIGKVSGHDLDLVEEKTVEVTRERGAFRANQFLLNGNAKAHREGTAQEIWKQAEALGYKVDAFCDFVGSGGTFAGCTEFFKEQNRNIQCFVVEPEGAAAIAGKSVSHPDHVIQGGGYSKSLNRLPLVKPIAERGWIDDFLEVRDEEAIYWTRELARAEGIFAGFSSGANIAAAVHLLRELCRGKTVVVVINDSGMKYFSTRLWDAECRT